MIRQTHNLEKALNKLKNQQSPIPEHIQEKICLVGKEGILKHATKDMDNKFRSRNVF